MRFFGYLLLAAGAAAVTLATPPGFAQTASNAASTWPNRLVTFIIPLTAGGPSDREIRLYNERLQQSTGQPFVVDFKPGGNAVIGNNYVAKSKPDGYTWLLTSSGFAIIPAFRDDLPYDTLKDFAPTSLVSKRAMLLVVSAAVPANSYEEYIAYARANPGKLNWGSAAQGGVTHLVGAWLHNATRTEVTFVHYKGSAPAVIDALAGRIDVVTISIGTGLQHFKSGKLKALALLTGNRVSALPQLRTVAELGIPDYEYPSWLGLLAPATTPVDIVNRMSAELGKAVRAPDLLAKLESEAIAPVGSTPAELVRVVASDVARWKKLVKDNNIKTTE